MMINRAPVCKDNEDLCFVPAPLEFKALDTDKGTFEGYGAVFGNRDDGWDVIEPGAFKKFKYKKGGKRIRIMAYHDSRMIVGDAEVSQDDKGLKVKGQLNFNLPDAAGVFEQMKDGGIDAMSVGFNILDKGAKYDDDYMTRYISKAELWEVSLVPFGMNSKARITSVKSGEVNDIRQFEKLLHANGFSRKQAKAIAVHGFGSNGQCDADLDPSEMLAIKQTLADATF